MEAAAESSDLLCALNRKEEMNQDASCPTNLEDLLRGNFES